MASAHMVKTMANRTRTAFALRRLWIAAVALVFTSSAYSVTMENIEFSSLPGDKTEIRMTFDGMPPQPTGYTIEQPARIALDLNGVTSGLDAKHHPLGSGNARSVTVVEAGERTRVIVSMTELVAYSARVVGNSLYVLVGADDTGMIASTSDTSIIGSTSSGAYEEDYPVIQEIDFRRGEQGEGRVIVRLSDVGVGVDVTTEGGNIRVEFANTIIPEALQRRLDVTDFATPVMIVDSLPEDGNTVMIVEPTGDTEYDYLAYQADNVFTLEVKTLTNAELEAGERAFRFRGEKLSLNFQDIEIRSVLQLIADFTDLNLVASDTVSGRITLRLKNVPWDQALEIIMRTKGLDKRLVGNVLMVAPAAELQAREQLELETRQQLSELAPLRTEFIEVKYANAAEIFSLFQSGGGGDGEGGGEGVISARGSVIVDERTNSIIITETTERINEFRQVLERLDVPVRQVLIEARIVTATSSFGDSLGVRWGALGSGNYNDGGTLTQFGGSLGTLESIRSTIQSGNDLEFDSEDNLIVDLGAPGNATTFAFGVVDKDFLLELELSALETEGRGEVIARPKVITSDKQTASIESGDQIPYQEASSSGATSTQFQDAVLGLNVTPRITPDDRIIMDLEINQDSIGAVFNGVPSIRTNSIQTQVLVNNGETIVLGGVFQTVVSEGVTKTPFLGDLPWVGHLFKQRTRSDDKQELLIFITPRLIRDSLTQR